MKHSHSCQSMPSVTLEEISSAKQVKSPALSTNSAKPALCSSELQQINENEEKKSNASEDIDETIRDLESLAQDPMSFEMQQKELSKKLEEVRIESRSTARDGLLKQKRPRAKSEEASKFPPERRPRPRLKSDGQTLSEEQPDEGKIR